MQTEPVSAMARMHRMQGPSKARRTGVRAKARAVFIDKDGTLVHDLPYNVDPALLRFTPNALEGLRLFGEADYRIVVVTNQPGIALGRFDKAALRGLQAGLTQRLAEAGIMLSGFYACPHAPPARGKTSTCDCRKPSAGLLHQAAEALKIDLTRSWMVGDILDDVEAGHRAGCRSVLLDVGNETLWENSPLRLPDLTVADLREAAVEILRLDAGGRAVPGGGSTVRGGAAQCTD